MNTCPNGHPVPLGSAFCGQCGVPLQPPPVPPGSPYSPYSPQPPQQPKKKRHIGRWVLGGIGGLIVVIVIASVASAGSHPRHPNTTAVSTSPASSTSASTAPAATPAPAASPAGNFSYTPCDVSLSDSLYGQNYLTAQLTEHNTGNIGIVVRVGVRWPLQGFAPITKTKIVHVKPGASKQVEFRYPASESQVSDFQNVQLGTSAENVCHYHGTITGTYGSVSG